MLALLSKFHGSRLIRSLFNKALLGSGEQQQQQQEQQHQEKHDFKAHMAGGSELARV